MAILPPPPAAVLLSPGEGLRTKHQEELGMLFGEDPSLEFVMLLAEATEVRWQHPFPPKEATKSSLGQGEAA